MSSLDGSSCGVHRDARELGRTDGLLASAPLVTAAGDVGGVSCPLRMGILCNGTTFQAWEAECIRQLVSAELARPTLLVVDAAFGGPSYEPGRGPVRRSIGWRAYQRVALGKRSRAAKPVDLSAELRGVDVLTCQALPHGKYALCFSEQDLSRIERYELDFILRFGFNIIRGGILRSARFGVWSFHHDDLEQYRGLPACFWTLSDDNPVQGVTLQRLTEGVDNGVVLCRGYLQSVRQSYRRSRDQAFFASVGFPARVCRAIAAGDTELVNGSPSATTAVLKTYPDNYRASRALFLLFRNKLRNIVHTLSRHGEWGIGMIDRPLSELITAPEFATGALPAPRWLSESGGVVGEEGDYLADPFAVPTPEGLCVLAERWDDRLQRGEIVALDWPNGQAPSAPRAVMSAASHLSYPYLLQSDGVTYCIPESAESREVVLYAAEEFPDRWRRVATLVVGMAALDASIFQFGDRWWMMCATKGRWNDIALHAFHAPSLTGPWTPHALNPLTVDVRCARPAGSPIVVDGVLYRLGQDCSETYGGAIRIMRVDLLTPQRFDESLHRVFRPDPNGPYPTGLHTLSAAGSCTMIDGKRERFRLRQFARECRSLAGRLRRRTPTDQVSHPGSSS